MNIHHDLSYGEHFIFVQIQRDTNEMANWKNAAELKSYQRKYWLRKQICNKHYSKNISTKKPQHRMHNFKSIWHQWCIKVNVFGVLIANRKWSAVSEKNWKCRKRSCCHTEKCIMVSFVFCLPWWSHLNAKHNLYKQSWFCDLALFWLVDGADDNT